MQDAKILGDILIKGRVKGELKWGMVAVSRAAERRGGANFSG